MSHRPRKLTNLGQKRAKVAFFGHLWLRQFRMKVAFKPFFTSFVATTRMLKLPLFAPALSALRRKFRHAWRSEGGGGESGARCPDAAPTRSC
jgi:hypothetical protein